MLTALRLFAPGNPAPPFSLPPFLPSFPPIANLPPLRIDNNWFRITKSGNASNRCLIERGGENRCTFHRSLFLFFSNVIQGEFSSHLSFVRRSIDRRIRSVHRIDNFRVKVFLFLYGMWYYFIYLLFIFIIFYYLFIFFISWSRSFISLLSSRKICSKTKVEEDERLSKNYLSRFYLFLIYPHVRSHSTTANFREFLARTQRVGIRAQLQSRVAAEINSHRDNSRGQGLVASYYRRGEAARRWRPINNLLFSETGEESVGPL